MSRVIGAQAENLAICELEKAGYKILERNFFARVGEVDIIAEEGDSICFIEVKFRHRSDFGSAADMVTKRKIFKILKSAKRYLYQKNLFNRDWRLDVVAIDEKNEVEILKNVYTEGMG